MSWSVLSDVSRRCGACVLLLLSGACGTSFTYQEVDVGIVPFEDVWVAIVEISETDGYPVDASGTDRGLRVFESRWRTRSVPFRVSAGVHRGDRRRVHAEMERPEDKQNWLVRFYVERQVITDITGAFDPQEDDWEAGGQDVDMEARIMAKLLVRFRAPGSRP